MTLAASLLGFTAATAQQPNFRQQPSQSKTAQLSTYMPPVHIAPRRGSESVAAEQQYLGVYAPDAAQTVRQQFQSRPPSKNSTRSDERRQRNNAALPRPSHRQSNASNQSHAVAKTLPRVEHSEPARTSVQNGKSILRSASVINSKNPPAPAPDDFSPSIDPVRTVSVQSDELDAQFEELEKPIERLSQTPAPIETRPIESSRQFNSESASVLGDDPRARPASTNRNGLPAADFPTLPMESSQPANSLRGNPSLDWNSNEGTEEYIESDLTQGATAPSQATLSCDELRRRLLSEPITDIALDLSPPLPKRTDELPPRPDGEWIDIHGRVIATGKLIELRRGYAIIETAQGAQKIPFAQLGDASLAQIAAAWQIPAECIVGLGSYSGRCWTPQLVTWYASNLCHKPLYFEDEQLERYGHSAGPFMGPLRSTAHFFVDAAFLPYKTAINPPNECIYSLGFYRPGNCAPWLKDPFPISLNGAARQGALLSGFFLLF